MYSGAKRKVQSVLALSTSENQIECYVERTSQINITFHIIIGWIVRCFLLICTLFCMFLSFIYSSGQLYQLSMSNFWCKKEYELAEIHEYNKQIGSKEGSITSCHNIGADASVDETALQSNSLDVYHSTVYITPRSVIFCILYAICGVLFCVVFLYHFSKIIYELCHLCGSNKITSNNRKESKTTKKKSNNPKCDKIKPVIKLFAGWWSKHCGKNKIGWVLRKYLMEIAEIILQFSVLLEYGGNSMFYDDDFELAEYPQTVIHFAIILGSNCIVNGILWINYALFANTCRSVLFAEILTACDMIFDCLYVIYPLIIAGKISFSTMGLYRIDSALRFIASFFPQLMLCWPLHRSLVSLTEWTQTDGTDYGRLSQLSVNVGSNDSKSTMSDDNSEHSKSRKKQFCCLFDGILFIFTGIAIIWVINDDILHSISFCTETKHDVDGAYPELSVYNDLCQYKVYKLFSSPPHYSCQCRLLTLSETLSNCESTQKRIMLSNHTSFGDIFIDILQKWNMLQVVVMKNCIGFDDVLYLEQKETFSSRHMQAFGIYGFDIYKIDGNISSWKSSLEFLELRDNNLFYDSINWNDGISELVNLKYFSLFANNMNIWPQSICKMKKLLFLELTGSTKLSTMDQCIGDLHDLQKIYFSWTGLNTVPASIWKLPNIQEIQFAFTANVTIQSSNILSMAQIPPKLNKLYFQGTLLCEEFENMANPNLSSSAYSMLSALSACGHVCRKNSMFEKICLPWSNGNGYCDRVCNVEECNWDNGDCHQLCDFNECDRNLYWNNGECDEQCNSMQCAWDQHDCIDDVNNSDIYCNNECDAVWLNDNFCDQNCMDSNCTKREEIDCAECIKETPCDLWSLYFSTVDENNNGFLEEYEICNAWNLVQYFVVVKRCNESTQPQYDLNHDGRLNAYDAMFVVVNSPIYSTVDAAKAKQLNCSVCMPHPSLYNA